TSSSNAFVVSNLRVMSQNSVNLTSRN
ncbi:helicase domain protein, partial [Vibrio parahaemolyticus V-223/04]